VCAGPAINAVTTNNIAAILMVIPYHTALSAPTLLGVAND